MNKMSASRRGSNRNNRRRSYRRLTSTAKQAFYVARRREGDVSRIAEMSGYSESHVSNIIAGRRSVNPEIANAMYNISRRRQRTSEMA